MLSTKVVIAKPARPTGPGSAGVQPTRSNALRVGSASGCRPIRSRGEMVALSMGSPSPNQASPGGHPPGFGLIELSNEPTAHTCLFPNSTISGFRSFLRPSNTFPAWLRRGRDGGESIAAHRPEGSTGAGVPDGREAARRPEPEPAS